MRFNLPNKFSIVVSVFIMVTVIEGSLTAQHDSVGKMAMEEVFNLTLEELMNVKISTASKTEEITREAPGIITLITSDDIRAGNCRDMLDVLNMVPGFTIQTDLLELQSFSSRGLYGFEGRALIMVDGMQQNDNFFGAYPLGNDFPLQVIDRIEIIRGPGSVLYGGAAELAVINILTKKPKNEINVDIAGNYGFTFDKVAETGHRDLMINIAQDLEKIAYSLYTSAGNSAKATSSDRLDYLSKDPNFPQYKINMNTTGNRNYIVGSNVIFNKRVELKLLYKNYLNKMPIVEDSVGNVWGGYWTRGELFENFNADISSTHKTFGFTIKPGMSAQYNLSWFMNSPVHKTIRETGVSVWRLKPYLNAERIWKNVFSEDELSFLIGGEYSFDYASQQYDQKVDGTDIRVLKKPEDDLWRTKVKIWNSSVYTSIKYNIAAFNFITSLRYDINELTGAKWSPRLGLTYVKPKFHAKLLYSEAYRAPNVANIASDYSIANYPAYHHTMVRESTKVYELEIGYRFTTKFFGSINLYSQVVEDIIEFNPDYNFLSTNAKKADGTPGKHGSEGFEVAFRYQSKKYRGILNISYILPGNKLLLGEENTDGETYMSPLSDGTYFNGVPRVKIYSNHAYSISKRMRLTLGLLYYSKRYEYRYDEGFNAYARLIPEQTVLNFGIEVKEFGIRNLAFEFSVHDIFNQQMKYVSAFDSYWLYDSTPFSSVNARGTELTVKFIYNFSKE